MKAETISNLAIAQEKLRVYPEQYGNIHYALSELIRRRAGSPVPGYWRKIGFVPVWYPDELVEECNCCRSLSFYSDPDLRYPKTLLIHCATVKHVAQSYGVSEEELKKKWRRAKQGF